MSSSALTYLNAIQKKEVTHTPIWIMRQAGRYLPEYQAVRDKYDFLTVCKTPELAAEVTLQPVRRFGFDAAILFSDILVIPEALGMKLEFLENHGPKLSPRIESPDQIERLKLENIEEKLGFVGDAVRLIRGEIEGKTPLIGFSGSPFTLAVYMIEGKPSRNFKHVKTMMFSEPERLKKLLDKLTDAIARYLAMQIKSGAQAVQIFDTWGGIIPVHLFKEFSGNYMERIVEKLKKYDTPVVLFSKGGLEILRQMKDSGAAMLGVDWMTDIEAAAGELSSGFALQGNLDPTALYGSREIIRKETDRILDAFRDRGGHVFNLGHGILPDIPVDNVKFLVDYVHESTAI